MFDLVITEQHTERDLLVHLLKGLHAMALDVSKLTADIADNSAAIAALSGEVDQLIALHTDPAAQAAVDAAGVALVANTGVVNALSAKVVAVLPVPPPPPAPVA